LDGLAGGQVMAQSKDRKWYNQSWECEHNLGQSWRSDDTFSLA